MLLGDADEIVQYLCERLGKGWTLPPALADVPPPPQAQATKDDERKTKKGKGVAPTTPISGGGGKNTVVKPRAPATLLMEPARIGARYVYSFSLLLAFELGCAGGWIALVKWWGNVSCGCGSMERRPCPD